MVKLSCFGAHDPGDEWNEDVQSNHNIDAALPPTQRFSKKAQHALFPHKRVLPREAAKQRLKKIINNMKKDHLHNMDKDRPVEDDPEYIILGKIYSELDASVDLQSIAKNRATLSHFLPFLLNALLYGFNDQSNGFMSGSGSGYHYGGSNNGGFYSRSSKKSSNLRLAGKDPKQINLNGISHLVKAQCEKQLEQFLYEQAMISVQFALECVWYLTTSLTMTSKESYHRTMTLLLGMESVVATSAPPGDLFKKAAVTETIKNPSSTPTSISPPSTESATISKGGKPGAVPDRVEDNGLVNKKSVREVDFDITGTGENPHRMQFSTPLKVGDEEKLQTWLDARIERANVFHAQLDFVKCLTDISGELFEVNREFRRDVLRRELEKLNHHIPKNVFIPTDRRPHRILRIVPEAAHVFNTKERVPYLLVFEVEDLAPPPPGVSPVVRTRHHHDIDGGGGGGPSSSGGGLGGGGDEGKGNGPLRRIGSIGEDGRIHSPLRRIGSIGASSIGKHSSSSALTAATTAEASSSKLQPTAEEHDEEIALQNQPESKFEFSLDVTAEANNAAIKAAAVAAVAAAGTQKRESSFRIVDAEHADDRRPPDEELLKALGEGWKVKSERLREASPFGDNPNWRLISVIVKARDQLRQEMFAQRLIQEFARIFEGANISVWLRPYQILSTSHDSGLIETVTDAMSIDSIKKELFSSSTKKNLITLQDYFYARFGGKGTSNYKKAIRNFVQSMAGYSVMQYLLNIKDRHNGNLMIDADGHVIHIDFGFLLSNSPGGNMEFEKSPFKLTNEMVQVMGGVGSSGFKLFKKLCIQGYLEACKYSDKILLMVDMMYPGNENMPCFLQGREYVLENLRERFGVDLSKKERANRMAKLVQQAHGNWTTKAYDQFQKVSLGIAK